MPTIHEKCQTDEATNGCYVLCKINYAHAQRKWHLAAAKEHCEYTE